MIDLDDKQRKKPKDTGYKCARRLLEAQRGKCTELLIIQSRMAQRIKILSTAVGSIKPCENVVVQSHGLTVTAHSSAPR